MLPKSSLFTSKILLSCILNIALFSTTILGMLERKEQGFARGTLIKTERGYSAIESLRENDRIISFNFGTRQPESDAITKLHRLSTSAVTQLTTPTQILEISDTHPLYSYELQTWIDAASLTDKAKIKTLSGALTVQKNRNLYFKNQTVPLYCLSVNKNHNFYASQDDILAHNMGGALGGIIGKLGPTVLKIITSALSGGGAIIITDKTMKTSVENYMQDGTDGMWKQSSNIFDDFNGQPIHDYRTQPSSSAPRSLADAAIAQSSTYIPSQFPSSISINATTNTLTGGSYGMQHPSTPQPGQLMTPQIPSAFIERLGREPFKVSVIETSRWGLLGRYETKETVKSFVSLEEYQKYGDHTVRTNLPDGRVITDTYSFTPSQEVSLQLRHQGYWDNVGHAISKEPATQAKSQPNTFILKASPDSGINPSLTPVAKPDQGCICIPFPMPESFILDHPMPEPVDPVVCEFPAIAQHPEPLITPAPKPLGKEDLYDKKDIVYTDEELRDKGGAQAPGMPTAEVGYCPPKKWDGKKVKVEKGKCAGMYGYPDKRGKIWVPTGVGGRAHRGPHWDVQYPNGTDHDNVLPPKSWFSNTSKMDAAKNAASTSSASASTSTVAGAATTKAATPAHVYEEAGWSQAYFSPATEEAHHTIIDVVSKDSQHHDAAQKSADAEHIGTMLGSMSKDELQDLTGRFVVTTDGSSSSDSGKTTLNYDLKNHDSLETALAAVVGDIQYQLTHPEEMAARDAAAANLSEKDWQGLAEEWKDFNSNRKNN